MIGAGYVGLTTAACLAHLGAEVRCSDSDSARIDLLVSGVVPILEASLPELVEKGLRSGRLSFGRSNVWAVEPAEFVVLCVPTPQGQDGRADLSYVQDVTMEIGPYLQPRSVLINKSTVPVGSTRVVERALGRSDVAVVSNPEFLREGSAVHDFLHPDRIVIGTEDEETAIRVSDLLSEVAGPVLVTDPATAETIKYASNAYLATKISFVNAMAALCEAVGANVKEVALGMGYDPRIGSSFLHPGPGWGGSCLPKDASALVRIADEAGYDFSLLKGVIAVNDEQQGRIVEKAVRLAGGDVRGKRLALWGATFKAHTSDLRSSPALCIGERLRKLGASVVIYDPTVVEEPAGFEIAFDAYDAARGAHVVVLATEWDQFRWIDFEKLGELMARPAIVDARNLLDPVVLHRAGFDYEGVGIG